jgi:hypothetical protein
VSASTPSPGVVPETQSSRPTDHAFSSSPERAAGRVQLIVDEPGSGIRSYTVRRSQSSSTFSLQGWRSASLLLLAVCVAAANGATSLVCVGIGSVILVAIMVHRAFSVREESLLIMEGIGLQLCTVYASGREITQFIDTAVISEVVIAEAVRVDRCFYYLACLVHGKHPRMPPQIIVPFKHLLPPLLQLEQIYCGTREVLWSEHDESLHHEGPSVQPLRPSAR